MKKLFLIIIGLVMTSLSIHSEIKTELNKYGVLSVYFISDGMIPTVETLRQDIICGIDIARTNKKVKQIHFKTPTKDFVFWLKKENINDWENEYKKIVNDFSKDDVIEIERDSVLTSYRIPAQYHSNTYKHGELISSYTSDWNSNHTFKSVHSEHIICGERYVTETYVTPAKRVYQWEYTIKEKRLIQKGETIRLKEIYGLK